MVFAAFTATSKVAYIRGSSNGDVRLQDLSLARSSGGSSYETKKVTLVSHFLSVSTQDKELSL